LRLFSEKELVKVVTLLLHRSLFVRLC